MSSHCIASVKGQEMCINIYDIRLEDTAPACGMNWPPEIPRITNFLGVSPCFLAYIDLLCMPSYSAQR